MCETATAIADLVKRLDAEIEFQQLRERWARHHEIAATTFSHLTAELADLCEPLDDAFTARAKAQGLAAIMSRTPGGLEPDWADPAALRRLRETAVASETAWRYEDARRQIVQTLAVLRTQSHSLQPDPTLEELRRAVTEREPSGYASARGRAASNVELEAKLRRRRALLQNVETIAPQLAGELEAAPADPVWDERAANFERAWNWRRAEGWLTRLAAPGADQQHRQQLESTKLRIAQTIEELAAEKAWAHCFERMTDHESQHLVAWEKAVQAIPKDSRSRSAPELRRVAREHFNECRSAIPAWIMPLHRVAEAIEPGSELFDIAIIDEASQSGPEALLLAYLAKKLVVVGDDRQIHPTYAGVNRQAVTIIRERHIRDLPFAHAYGVDHSFFDLASIRYQGRIRLREHFRCMPEIIQFSNNLSYQGEPLIPLRQYGADRLKPVVTHRVPDGYQQGTAGNAVNPPEADAITAEIVRMCGDPAYEGKTIGVISLLGAAQARQIESRLVRQIRPEEMERRRIVCGDAYAFQGDERDVMLLSLVSASSEEQPTVRALTDAPARRRFNVAASRARDQMVLFHTPTLNELSANPDCVRRLLLKYCLKPKVGPVCALGVDVPDLERIAAQTRREIGNQPRPFDSWFEVDVCLRIVRREYCVIPQWEVHGYRIDLVVQGTQGSLAVECDGDHWHGPDRYAADVARQRDLERCGWTFWRVRESEFRLDPDEALSDLWKTLERRGIFPTAAGEPPKPGRDADPPSDSQPPEPPVEPELPPVSSEPGVEPTPTGAVADPSTMDQAQLIALLADIVEREGPVVAMQAYQLINRAAGNRQLATPARRALNRACATAVRTGVLIASNPSNEVGQAHLVLESPGGTPTTRREHVPRDSGEIPPS